MPTLTPCLAALLPLWTIRGMHLKLSKLKERLASAAHVVSLFKHFFMDHETLLHENSNERRGYCFELREKARPVGRF